MSVDIQLFAETFKSEESLRQYLFELFRRMPGTTGVAITHGPQEYGKDLVFYFQDALGDSQLCACVVKNDKISGSADSNHGARNVFNQVEQALDTQHINSVGENEYVTRVYVISPYDCSQVTMRSIQGKLRERQGQVKFLCGSELLEKFDRFWPEFRFLESSWLGSYVASLQKSLKESDPISFLGSQHEILSGATHSISKLHVRQNFEVTLRRLDLLLDKPHLQALSAPHTEDSVTRLSASLVFLADFASLPQVWEGIEHVPDEATLNTFKREARELRNRWVEEYQRQAKDVERGGKMPKRDAASLSVALGEDSVLRVVCNALSEMLSQFEKKTASASEFACRCADPVPLFYSDEYLNYCRVEEVFNSFPAAFLHDHSPRTFVLPKDLVQHINGPFLITAPAGFGKTSFCRSSTLLDLKNLETRCSTSLPIYIPLHQLSTGSYSTSEEAFLRSADTVTLVREAVSAGQQIHLYLDGLDEVPRLDQQRRLMELADEFRKSRMNVKVIVTGRGYVSGPWLRWLPRISLARFNDEQVLEFIDKWLGEGSTETTGFKDQMSSSGPLQDLMHVPLLGTLIIAVYRRMHSLPESQIKLYDIFIELMCGGWDLAKNVARDSRYGSVTKIRVLTSLAATLQLNHAREATDWQVRLAVERIFPSLVDEYTDLLDELLQDGLVMRVSSAVMFSHLSFQEFLAARDLSDPTGSRQTQALKMFFRGDDWWREVLSFYVALSSRPLEIEQWIAKVAHQLSSEQPAESLITKCEFLFSRITEASPGWVPNLVILPLRLRRLLEAKSPAD